MSYGLRAQSALLVRGSSRRIMTLRFQPAHIRVINPRERFTAAIGFTSKQKKPRSPLTAKARPEKQRSTPGGLDKSLHIRKADFLTAVFLLFSNQ
jgi:hypothetical protein